ncbi:MAG: GntR family transcriptional regulator [Planctomycetes bacterium]|jgi:GntR family transcriptional regulator|nr:GntR family transcriptional regulator [Planctomycetota bacterium]
MNRWRDAIRVDATSPLPVYAQIERQVALLLASGAFAPGDQIPSVRELAAALGVNPLTVSKAYGRLAERGAVETVKGRGVFAAGAGTGAAGADREALLRPRVDDLLAEAARLGIPPDRVEEMVRARSPKRRGDPEP